MSFWSVVQTISGHESAVAERIERIGYRTLTPKARFRIKGQMKIAAVFPGYLFAEIIAGWYDIRWCMGVLRLIMNGEEPAHMPDTEIAKIENEMGRNGLMKLPKAKPPTERAALVFGTPVKILTGSFRGFSAIYQGMSPRERELVLLDILGGKTPVELNEDDRVAPLQLAPEQQLRY